MPRVKPLCANIDSKKLLQKSQTKPTNQPTNQKKKKKKKTTTTKTRPLKSLSQITFIPADNEYLFM